MGGGKYLLEGLRRQNFGMSVVLNSYHIKSRETDTQWLQDLEHIIGKSTRTKCALKRRLE